LPKDLPINGLRRNDDAMKTSARIKKKARIMQQIWRNAWGYYFQRSRLMFAV
jgi:hypothetical protein